MDSINELTARKNEFAADKGSNIAFFLEQVNKDIREINGLINQYNLVKTNSEKQLLLNKMNKNYHILLNKYPPSFLAYSADFSEQIENKLFNLIKNERSTLGMISRHADNSLSHVIENMSPEKISQLMDILSSGSQFKPEDVYNLYSDTEDDYDNFQQFLSNITEIKFLGGGNSKNFKITYPNGNTHVLKLENRLDQPALIEEQLQSGILKNVLTPVQVKRHGTFTYLGTYEIKAFPLPDFPQKNTLYIDIKPNYIQYSYLDNTNQMHTDSISANHPKYKSLVGINYDNLKAALPFILEITNARGQTQPVNRTINRSLVVTDFCSGGDLEYHQELISGSSKKIKSALEIYIQMGDVLNNLIEENYAFPDMKNSNWLIDKTGKLKIADTKSFIYINENGNLDRNIIENQWHGMPQSRFMNPPEMMERDFQENLYPADKMHVYMLGKNLYQYLSGCTASELAENKFVFSNDVFKTKEGHQLKTLLQSMLRSAPSNRISTAEALEKLIEIQIYMMNKIVDKAAAKKAARIAEELAIFNKKEECKILVKTMEHLQFGSKDEKMISFFLDQNSQIRNSSTLADLEEIYIRLTTLLDSDNQYGQLQLKAHLAALKKSVSYYLDFNNKYRQIKNAILQVPVEERMHINKTGQTYSKAVNDMQATLNQYSDKAWLNKFYNPHQQNNSMSTTYKRYKEKLPKAIPDEAIASNPMLKKSQDHE